MGISIGNKQALPVITYYTSSATWTKQDRLFAVVVCCIGPGGGAGGGIAGTPSQNLRGGGPGGGGATVYRWIPAYLLSSSVSITVPTGGRGGSGSVNTTGNAGSSGADTTFGSWVIADGGGGGPGGSTGSPGTGAGGSIANCVPNYYPLATAGIQGSNSYDSVPSTGFLPGGQIKPIGNSLNTVRVGAPGGSWGGTKLANSAPYAGVISGGAIHWYWSGSLSGTLTQFTYAGGAGGANSPTSGSPAETGSNGTSNAFLNWLIDNPVTASFGPGTGGGKGGFGSGSNGGNGGNGGNYGAGAGGGGSCLTPWTGGNGGNGGGGICVVIEYYGG